MIDINSLSSFYHPEAKNASRWFGKDGHPSLVYSNWVEDMSFAGCEAPVPPCPLLQKSPVLLGYF